MKSRIHWTPMSDRLIATKHGDATICSWNWAIWTPMRKRNPRDSSVRLCAIPVISTMIWTTQAQYHHDAERRWI